ncbi:uncharacterized protein [Watersipora subatra]|uniref:uncharacterized protein n=1 Tax=Watersipora subatra TaxID=2589382 RepID=UPI00355AFDBC
MGGPAEKRKRKNPPSKKQKALKRSRVTKKSNKSATDSTSKKSTKKPNKILKMRNGEEERRKGCKLDETNLKSRRNVGQPCPMTVTAHRPSVEAEATINLGTPVPTRSSCNSPNSVLTPRVNLRGAHSLPPSTVPVDHNFVDAPTSSMAVRLAPLSTPHSLLPKEQTVCPVTTVQRPLPKGSKMSGVAHFDPSLCYTSTVVTMTNNMNAIKKHSDKSKDSSPHELLKLIDNVQKNEQQITNTLAGVDEELMRTTSARSSSPTRRGDFNIRTCRVKPSEIEGVDSLSSSNCNLRLAKEVVINGTLPEDRKSSCQPRDCSCTSSTSQSMDTLTNQKLNSNARLLWLSEQRSNKAEMKKGSSQTWSSLSARQRQPFIDRARLAMDEPALPATRAAQQDETGTLRTRKKTKASALGKIKVNKRTCEPKVPKAKGGDLVLTVTHPTMAPAVAASVPVTVEPSSQSPSSHAAVARCSQSKPSDRYDMKRPKVKKSSSGFSPPLREDYNGCQEAQRFYSMPGTVQKLYLERELLECRGLMNNSQLKTMLNDYKHEYTEVRRTFIAANNLMSSRTKKENLEIIQRSILYSKIQHHKQQAINSGVCPFPLMDSPNLMSDFHSLVDYIIDTGICPPVMYPTCSPELTLVLDSLNTVTSSFGPEDNTAETARQSDSYVSILNSLLSAEQCIDSESSLPDCDIPLLLSLSETALDLHLDS